MWLLFTSTFSPPCGQQNDFILKSFRKYPIHFLILRLISDFLPLFNVFHLISSMQRVLYRGVIKLRVGVTVGVNPFFGKPL